MSPVEGGWNPAWNPESSLESSLESRLESSQSGRSRMLVFLPTSVSSSHSEM